MYKFSSASISAHLPLVSCWKLQSLHVTVSLSPGRGSMVPQCGQKDGSVLNKAASFRLPFAAMQMCHLD